MKTVDNIELTTFLANKSKNMVIIHFNQDHFLSLGGNNANLNFADFQGKWLFADYSQEKNDFIYSKNYTLQGVEFNLNKYFLTLWNLYKKWEDLCPLIPFPDVVITPNDFNGESAFLSYDKLNYHHTIYLTLNELESIDRFKYVIGHELGHLYYNIEQRPIVEKKLNANKLKRFFPFEVGIFVLLSLGLNIMLLVQSNPLVVKALALGQVVIWGGYLLMHLLSFERLKNYSAEFFCDYFSFHFAGPCGVQQLGLLDSRGHCYTHPSGRWRKSVLKRFIYGDLSLWENPVEEYSSAFRNMNIYEFSYGVSELCKKISIKLGKLFKKDPKKRKIKTI